MLLAMVAVIFTITTTAGVNLAFIPAYASSFKFSTTQALVISLVGVSLGLVLMPAFGHLSDRAGRKWLTITGIALIPFAVWLALSLITTGSFIAADPTLVQVSGGYFVSGKEKQEGSSPLSLDPIVQQCINDAAEAWAAPFLRGRV